MDDWPITISCDPDFPIIGPAVGEIREESIIGLQKGKAHIKITVKLKYAQNGKKKYVWNLKKYPVGYND